MNHDHLKEKIEKSETQPELSGLLTQISRELIDTNQNAAALVRINQLEARFQALSLADDVFLLRIRRAQGICHISLRNYPEARILLEQALTGYQNVGLAWEIGRVHQTLDVLFYHSRQIDESLAHYQEAEKCYRRVVSENPNQPLERSLAFVYNAMGMLYLETGQFSKAEAMFSRTIELLKIAHGRRVGQQNLYGQALFHLADVSREQMQASSAKYPAALSYARQAIRILRRQKDNLSLAWAYWSLGMIYRRQRMIKRALRQFTEAAKIAGELDESARHFARRS